MKKFMIRIVNVCMIVAALFGYNHVTLAHEKIDAEAKAEADRQSAELAAEAGVNGGNYTSALCASMISGIISFAMVR